MFLDRLILKDDQVDQISTLFRGKSILVTGGTGSFGKKFIKRVLDIAEPRRIIVFSRDELKQFEMQNDSDFQGQACMRFFIGDVRDKDRVRIAMRDVDFVVHAAALKQVPAAEYNPFECIKTNVIGAENVIEACMFGKVQKLVALSTDKACSPANLYGASKLASDKLFVAANNLAGGSNVRFAVVRYGNVFGSRGSVVPFFANLLSNGVQSLPITDEGMTRFIITLQQGVDFVLSSFIDMRGGEIFVPKIPSLKITDIAEVMAPGMPQDIIGIRPGEKLHEAMIAVDDARQTIDLGDRYVIEPTGIFYDRESFHSNGYPFVSDDFAYDSGRNEEWLGDDDVIEMMKNHGFMT